MKKLFLVMFVALAAGGCTTAPVEPYGTTGGFIFYQVGVAVRVVNNCAPLLDFETISGVVVQGLPYGGSATIPLVSQPLGGSYRRLSLTVKGYTASREYLGSATREFYVSTYAGSYAEVWEIDRLNLPGGRGGCK